MFDTISSFFLEIIGAFIFWILNGFKGKLSDQMSGPYETNKKSLRNGITSIAVILIIITILSSCSSKKDNSIIQFEEYIGETYTNILDSMIIAFKHVVDQPIGSNNFEYFINKTISDSLSRNDWLKNSIEAAKIKRRIKESGLRDDIYFDIYDVKYIDDVLISTYKYWDIYNRDSITVIDSTFIFQPRKLRDTSQFREKMVVPSDFNIQEYVNKRKNQLVLNDKSRFYRGLKLSCKDSIIQDYITYKEMSKWCDLVSLAKGFEYGNPNYNNYFLQRVIALELFIPETLLDFENIKTADINASINYKPKVIALPPYDEISNRGISPKIQKYLEEQLLQNTKFTLNAFPHKDLLNVPYQNIFDKIFCKPITENIDCDIITMSKIDLVKKTGNISSDLWNARFKIYNVNTNTQINSKVKIDSLNSLEINSKLQQSSKELIKEIENTIIKQN